MYIWIKVEKTVYLFQKNLLFIEMFIIIKLLKNKLIKKLTTINSSDIKNKIQRVEYQHHLQLDWTKKRAPPSPSPVHEEIDW